MTEDETDLKTKAIIFLVLGAILAFTTFPKARYFNLSESLQETSATVIDTKKRFQPRGRHSTAHYIVEYTVETDAHLSKVFEAEIHPTEHALRARKGDRVTIYYYPSNPGQPYWARNELPFANFLFFVSLLMMFFGAKIFFYPQSWTRDD